MSVKYPGLDLQDLEFEDADKQKQGKPGKSPLSSTGQRTKKGCFPMMADPQRATALCSKHLRKICDPIPSMPTRQGAWIFTPSPLGNNEGSSPALLEWSGGRSKAN